MSPGIRPRRALSIILPAIVLVIFIIVSGCITLDKSLTPRIHEAKSGGAAVSSDGKLYYLGGYTLKNASDTIEEYDPSAGKWTIKGRLPEPRAWPCAAAINDSIYIIGGMNSSGYGSYLIVDKPNLLDTVVKYTPSTGNLTRCAPLLTPRLNAIALPANGEIYVIGGCTNPLNMSAIDTVEAYDPANNTWRSVTHIPATLQQFSAAVIDDRIYVMGGVRDEMNNSTLEVYVYDTKNDTWSNSVPLDQNRRGSTACTVDGRIYILGGDMMTGLGDYYCMAEDIEVFDPGTGSWTSVGKMQWPRCWQSSAAIGDRIYTIGGTSGTVLPWCITDNVESFDTGG